MFSALLISKLIRQDVTNQTVNHPSTACVVVFPTSRQARTSLDMSCQFGGLAWSHISSLHTSKMFGGALSHVTLGPVMQ